MYYRALSNAQGTPEYATVLAFDVKIDNDARRHADENGVKIFTADIIYHLFDQFTAHMDRLMEQRRQDAKNLAVFPCIVKVKQQLLCREASDCIPGESEGEVEIDSVSVITLHDQGGWTGSVPLYCRRLVCW